MNLRPLVLGAAVGASVAAGWIAYDLSGWGNRSTEAQAPPSREEAAFAELVRTLGYQTGTLNSYVTKCLPKWTDKLAGPHEISVFLGRLNTPKAITANGLEAFRKGADNGRDMTCGTERSSEISAVTLSLQAAETIRDLKALSLQPSVFQHRGNLT